MDHNYKLIHNSSKQRFEFHIDGYKPHIEYRERGNKIYLDHTRVPTELEGKGIASNLVKQVFRIIEQRHLILVPICDFVKSYLERHPEWNYLTKERS